MTTIIMARIIGAFVALFGVLELRAYFTTGCFRMDILSSRGGSPIGGFAQVCGWPGTFAIALCTVVSFGFAYTTWKMKRPDAE
jgi:hypothetical protein